MYSTADHARLTRRIAFSPRAATRFGVKPNSVMRAAMAHSATASASSALTTRTTCTTSKAPGGDGIEQKAKDNHQEQVEGDERVPPDVDSSSGPQQGHQKRDQHGGEQGS